MNKRKKKSGLPPGTVVFTGRKKVESVVIHYLQYDESTFKESALESHHDIVFSASPDEKVDWYDVRGIHDTELIEFLGKTFQINPLVLEDVSDTHQRPKFDEYKTGSAVVLRAIHFDKTQYKIQSEQVTLYFRKGLLISFQEDATDLFETIRKRIKLGQGRIRTRGSDYLFYALLDVIIDNYLVVLEDIEVEIETLEDRIVVQQDVTVKSSIHKLKRELLLLRKSIAPSREAISKLYRSESPFIEESTSIYLRDLYDHIIHVVDITDSYRDLLNGLQDLYISEVSFKMNQVMQVLTVVATIFIPMTFLAGIYGMNFENMPELKWPYSYYIFWSVIVVTAIVLLYFFRKKRYL